LILRPLTLEQLWRGAHSGDAGPLLGFPPEKRMPRSQRAMQRKIYKAKAELMEMSPEAWLLSTAWQMIARDTGELVGEIGFKGPPRLGEIELGYSTRAAFRGRGYMPEAVAALCRFAFAQTQHPTDTVCAVTERDNLASQRVLQKCGFARGGVRNGLLLWQLCRQGFTVSA
jgi:RimJ/RimL family protein N-acetyltransferase